MFKNLLIANRGEIAIRIARTAAALGIETIAVYSEDDAQSLHILRTDEKVPLSGRGPQAYLDQEQILRIARETHADAIHPGYGFLSESAEFAERVENQGLRFVGPHCKLLRLFGDKGAARRHALRCGVEVPRGTEHATSLEEAETFFGNGLSSLMVKAVSGGGGRGMRVVHRKDALKDAFREAGAEALAAFGNADLYIEEYIPRARHIEVQVVGDGECVVSLGERECTLQRRHQKVIEVAPSPSLSTAARKAIIEAALRMADAASYDSIGTFEFLVQDAGERFVFIECNPRLQVEHTVTEEFLDIDIVRAQLEIASGRRVSTLDYLTRITAPATGYAIQMRVSMETLAEDGVPRPTTGILSAFDVPSGPDIRVDTFGYVGYRANPRFDALLAKVIVRSPLSYENAVGLAYRAINELRVEGVETNRSLLQNLLVHPAVIANEITTDFIGSNLTELCQAHVDRVRHFPTLTPTLNGFREITTDDVPENTVPILSPLSGSIIEIRVKEGDLITPRTVLAVVTAMKMQTSIYAGVSGIVRSVLVGPDDVVAEGEPIVFVEPSESQVSDIEIEIDGLPENISASLARMFAWRDRTLDSSRPAAIDKLRNRGKRSARQNIADLCDPGSFLEFGTFAAAHVGASNTAEELFDRGPGDGLICGYATINAEIFGLEATPCVVLSFDQSVFAGSLGMVAKHKIEKVIAIAERGRLPLVFFAEGGGARSGESDGDNPSASLDTFLALSRLKGKSPLVGIVAGRCFAANAAFVGVCDVIIATRDASIGMAGPAMIEGAGLGQVAAEHVGPAAMQSKNGVVDVLVDTEVDAIAVARRYVGYFQGQTPTVDHADQTRLRGIVPEDRFQAYDVLKAIHIIGDIDSVTELRADFGRSVITAFIRVNGVTVGILANNSRHLGGAVDADAADKSARFMQHCDAFGIPLVTLCDTPGFMVGPQAEQKALVRHVSRMMVVGARLTVPHFSIVLRKCYGLGGLAMSGGSHSRPLYYVSWPGGEFGAMNAEGSVRIARKRELAAIDDPAEREAVLRRYAAEIFERGRALNLAARGGVDEVIDPADTRKWITTGIRAAKTQADGHPRQLFLDTW